MSENRVVGILSRLDLEWLELAAAKVVDGCSSEEVRAALFERLSPLLAAGEKRGSACYKTVTVLARVWLTVSAEAVGLRDRALELLPNATQQERTALHWAMLCVSYPFWADVAAAAGRLLSLQGVVVLTQLTRRMTKSWGDRSTVKRSSQRIARSMVRWGTMTDSETKGMYNAAPRITLSSQVGAVLIEALLLHEQRALPVDALLRHPAMFPFKVIVRVNELRDSERFEVYRQGLDEDVVRLVS